MEAYASAPALAVWSSGFQYVPSKASAGALKSTVILYQGFAAVCASVPFLIVSKATTKHKKKEGKTKKANTKNRHRYRANSAVSYNLSHTICLIQPVAASPWLFHNLWKASWSLAGGSRC